MGTRDWGFFFARKRFGKLVQANWCKQKSNAKQARRDAHLPCRNLSAFSIVAVPAASASIRDCAAASGLPYMAELTSRESKACAALREVLLKTAACEHTHQELPIKHRNSRCHVAEFWSGQHLEKVLKAIIPCSVSSPS